MKRGYMRLGSSRTGLSHLPSSRIYQPMFSQTQQGGTQKQENYDAIPFRRRFGEIWARIWMRGRGKGIVLRWATRLSFILKFLSEADKGRRSARLAAWLIWKPAGMQALPKCR